MHELKNIYQNKKILVTGHTGFKGSWLCVWLKMMGAQIKGYALEPENPSLYKLIEKDLQIDSYIGDIRNRELFKQEILNFQPDLIFHLAAQPLVLASYEQPIETFDTNVMGTVHLLDAVRFLEKPCAVVCITTDKVYENNEWIYPYRETDHLGGHDPYSSSKAACEIIIQSYRRSFFNLEHYNRHHKAIASARAGNVIGGGDFAVNRIVPDLLKALANNEPLQVRNPEAVRPWQHVLEPLGGYLLLGQKLYTHPTEFAEAYNFGPWSQDNLPVEALIKLLIASWGSGDYHTPENPNKLHEAGLLKLDISKSVNKLNWQPKLNISTTVDMIVDWTKNYTHQNPFELCKKQVEGYVNN
ncbi:MAG: CDP-glucose 4,6-dehydratase [Bacteroidota bacterium]|nr:CDP-glucose 4,6-dehydratase [Bacteroidota bacterium]